MNRFNVTFGMPGSVPNILDTTEVGHTEELVHSFERDLTGVVSIKAVPQQSLDCLTPFVSGTRKYAPMAMVKQNEP